MDGDAAEAPVLRRALAADGPEVAGVFEASRSEALPYLPTVHSHEEDCRYFSELARSAAVWVAEAQGRIVALLVLNGRTVEHLYVLPAYQRRGIGSRLLALAKSTTPQGLRLYTFQRNEPARAFYERRGFVAAAFGDGSQNEEAEPDVLYQWSGAT